MNGTSTTSEALRRAAQAAGARQWDEAIRLYEEVLAQDQACAAAHQGLAVAAFQAGDVEKSISHFRRVTDLNPTDGRALVNLGAALNRAGRYGDAVFALRRGLRLDARCAEGFYNLGIAQRKMNQIEMAAAAYREAIRLAPGMAEAHQNLANILLETGKAPQAAEHYRKALDLRPSFDRAQAGLAEALKQAGRSQPAVSMDRIAGLQSTGPQEVRVVVRAHTPLERANDIRRLKEISTAISAAADEMLEVLRGSLTTQLHDLDKLVTAGRSGIAAEKPLKLFQMAHKLTRDKGRTLILQLQLLGRHEQAAATPGGLL